MSIAFDEEKSKHLVYTNHWKYVVIACYISQVYSRTHEV